MEPYLYSEISPMFGFLVGVVSGLGLVGLWRGIRLLSRLACHSSGSGYTSWSAIWRQPTGSGSVRKSQIL